MGLDTTVSGQAVGTIEVPGHVLLRMAEAVIPHAAEEAYSPGLCAVQWEVRGGALWLAATDTRTVAAARCPAGGDVADGGPVLLPVSGTMRLARMAAVAGGALAAVRIDPGELAVTVQAGNGRFDQARWPLLPGRHAVPDWRQMLGGLLTGPRLPAGEAVAADSRQLCRFAVRSALADRTAGGWPARLRLELRQHAGSRVRAWLVLCEDWFAGAIIAAGPRAMDVPGDADPGQWAAWVNEVAAAGEGSL